MKRKMTFIATCLGAWLAVSSFGQWTAGHEYRPFLKEGKTWLVQYDTVPIERNHYPNDSCLFYLKGDTTINDKVYMKAYRQFIGSEPAYYAALRETDKTVYMIHGTRSESEESTLYDFNKQVNQFFDSYMSEGEKWSHMVRIVGDVKIRGNIYWRQIVEEALTLGWKSDFSAIYEGIGSERNPFALSSYCTLLSCYEGETCLYEKGDEIKDYEPFLVEGKVWRYAEKHMFIDNAPRDEYEILKGDTVIDGHRGTFLYKASKADFSDAWKYAFMYEEDHKVYIMGSERKPQLLYDFDPEPEELIPYGEYEYVALFSRDTIRQKGGSFPCMRLKVWPNDNENVDENEENPRTVIIEIPGEDEIIWIEGVGGPCWYPEDLILMNSCESVLVSCTWPDGKQYVTEYGEKYLESIKPKPEPLLVEGKTWAVRSCGPAPDCDILYTYTLKGDTSTAWYTYKKLYVSAEGIDWGKPYSEPLHYVGALYERGSKVYFWPAEKYDYLLYDFNLDIDEVFSTWGDNRNFKLEARDTVEQKGVEYARQIMSVGNDTKYNWVEGVGSETGLLYTGAEGELVGSSQYLISCTWPDGRQYVTEEGKQYLEGIRSTKNEQLKMNNEMFDLQGRRVIHPKKGEIYIKNGRKYRE